MIVACLGSHRQSCTAFKANLIISINTLCLDYQDFKACGIGIARLEFFSLLLSLDAGFPIRKARSPIVLDDWFKIKLKPHSEPHIEVSTHSPLKKSSLCISFQGCKN